MAFEHYIHANGRQLRCGFTTGTCAALAAAGAAQRLLLGRWPEQVSLITPKGLRVETPLENCRFVAGTAFCAVRKDAGDDIDKTDGALITAAVTCTDEQGIAVDGGEGVGRVTKPGLDQPVGRAAINRVPRQMIAEAVRQVCVAAEYNGGIQVIISVPEGRKIAEKTFNPSLGVVGGISILGTSGIVEPMSDQALLETIALELRQVAAQGYRRVIMTPGNYGMDYVHTRGLDALGIPTVKCSNFIGPALDEAVVQGFTQVLLVGHVGKLVKLAAGIMNTHSRWADCRTELFCAYTAVCGGERETCQALLGAATSDACVEILDAVGLRQPVLDRLLAAIQLHLDRRMGEICRCGAVLFSNVHGGLGDTAAAKEMLAQWRRESCME